MRAMRRNVYASAAMALAVILAAADRAAADYQTEVASDSPVHYWSFDEAASGTANALDSGSGASGTDGVFSGGSVRTTGLIGTGAALYNGTTGGVADAVGAGTANYGFTTGVTIEAVIQPNGTISGYTYGEIFRKEDGNDRLLFSFQNNGTILSFGMNDTGVSGASYSELDMVLDGKYGRPTLAQLTDGNVHHVVASYDDASGTKAIYVDGMLAFWETRSPGDGMSSGTGAGIATIGNGSPVGGEPFDGTIDEVALYEGALSKEQIFTHAFLSGATSTLNLSRTVLGPGTYNAGPVGTSADYIGTQAPSSAASLPVQYNSAGGTIELAPYINSGATGGNFGSDTHGRSGNLWIVGDGETNEQHIGFGAHANWLVTFDLDDIRDEYFDGDLRPFVLDGSFGTWGSIGGVLAADGVIQPAIFLDGVRIDSLVESTHNVPTVGGVDSPSQAFSILITSGKYLTLAILNGNDPGISTQWDDGVYRNVTLTLIPSPAALPAGLALLLTLAARRRR